MSPSEEDSHIIQLEMMVMHHFKSPIGSSAFPGTADNCTVSAYVNKQCKVVFTVLCCKRPQRDSTSSVYISGWQKAEPRGLSGGTQERGQSPNILSQIWTLVERVEVNLFALRQITHYPLYIKDNAAAQCFPTPLFYLSPYQA